MSRDPLERAEVRPATQVVHAGGGPIAEDGALVPPLPMAVVFAHDNPLGYTYGRDHNSNWLRLEGALAQLEVGAGAVAFGSGMAAIAAVLEVCAAGAKVVASRDAYTGTRELLRHLAEDGRVQLELVDATDLGALRRACSGAKLLWVESLGNPLLSIPDLAVATGAARAEGALTVVDNTFATPLLVRPLELGADLVVHSLSKYVGGHSDLMLGAVVARESELLSGLRYQRTNFGGIPGQLEVWLALRGLRTLDVRLRRQVASAARLAEALHRVDGVRRVHYPSLAEHPQHQLARRQMPDGGGAMLAIELAADAEQTEAFCAATRIWTNATSLGSVESLLERRARWAGDEYLPPSLVRLSVGLEDVEDLLQDLLQALRRAGISGSASPESGAPTPAG